MVAASPVAESIGKVQSVAIADNAEGSDDAEPAAWRNGISETQCDRSINILSPPARLKPSEWADRLAYLPAQENAEPGKFHLSRRPHQAAMLDDPLDQSVREIFWMGAAQAMGKTVCFILLIMYVIHQMRKSIIMVRPTIDNAKDWRNDKLIPTVEATPCMEGLLIEPRAKGGNSKMLNQKYPGGSLKLIGANSASGFRSSSVPIVLGDEVDDFVDNPEGDPLDLAQRGAITFSEAWLINASTTTLEGFSRIHAGYKTGDQQLYFVPCLHCGHFQDLQTERMKFSFKPEEHVRFETSGTFKQIVNNHTWEIGAFPTIDTPRTLYVCEHCNRGWTDAQRMDAYYSGHPSNPPVIVNGNELRAEWRSTAPFNSVRSRGMNGMYTVVGLKKGYANYLHQFAENYLKAKRGGRAKLQVWTNLFKNEPFTEVSEKMDWQKLKERAEDYGPELEPQVMIIYGAIDVQKDHVEILWVGFGYDEEAWLLEYEVVACGLDQPDDKDRLFAHLSAKRFPHPYSGDIAPKCVAIDYGHKSRAVEAFCKKYGSGKIWPVKGVKHEDMVGITKHSKDKRGRIRLLLLNVDVLKSQIFDRLNLADSGPNYIHIPKETVTYADNQGVTNTVKTSFNSAFYMGLCSERRYPKRHTDGTITYRWEKNPPSAKNEPLDMLDYIYGLYADQKPGAWIASQWIKVKKLMAESEQPSQSSAQSHPQPLGALSHHSRLESAPQTVQAHHDLSQDAKTQPENAGSSQGASNPLQPASQSPSRPESFRPPRRHPQRRVRPPWANAWNPFRL